MKHTYIKSFFAFTIAVALFATTGCKKLEDFGKTDDRDDLSTQGTTINLLTNAQAGLPSLMSSTIGGIRGELYSQQWSETQYTDVSLYGNPQLDFAHYLTSLKDLEQVIALNTNPATKSGFNVLGTAVTPAGSNGSQIAIAKILMAYYYWTITDRWGDVPYSEALKGDASVLTPKYDKQEDIYKDLLAKLKESMTDFVPTAAVRGDIFYPAPATPAVASQASIDAQIAKWKKVANSLRMLIALRMSKVYPAAGGFAATEFADASNDAAGSITTNADNLVVNFIGGSALQTNVFYSALNGRKDYAFSQTLGDILSHMGDTRRSVYGSTGTPFPYGLARADAVAFDGSVSGAYATPINPANRAVTSPVVILPASYVLLAKAEAAERGWTADNAQAMYEAGVTASFAQWGQAASAAAYLAGSYANYASGEGGGTDIGFNATFPSIVAADAVTTTPLQRIQLQKYLASFGDGVQAWCEWRRTGVPNLKPTVYGTNTPREIPRRLTYGTGEYAGNPAGVAEAVSRLTGGDKMNSRMWWDQ